MKKILLGAMLFSCLSGAVNSLQAQGKFLDKVNKFAGKEDDLGRYEGANYIVDGNGSITFEDGTTKEGTVKFIVSTNMTDLKFVWFTPSNEMEARQWGTKDVKFFTVKNKSFYPVRTKEDDLSIGNSRIFMERLNGSDDDKFKMFFLRKLEVTPKEFAASKPYTLSTGYYVMLPEFKNAHEIIDVTFTPFAKKMSEYLKDCPEVSEKIKEKKDGYKYNVFKGAENNEVFLRIMDEYNKCAK